jgi:nitroreductase
MNEVIQTLKGRRSIRKYRAEQIRDEELREILAAGAYAASAKNKQSAYMVAVRDRETLTLLSRINAEIWGTPDIDPFYGAPMVVVVLADPEATTADNADRDGALVMGNLMNAAWSLGVGSCWINRAKETFERPEGKELLKKWGLPERLIGVGNCILGYAAGDIPDPRSRKEGHILYV